MEGGGGSSEPARLSVVVVTYNSHGALGAGLPALRSQLRPDDELIVVDNASSDGSAEAAAQLAPEATVVRSEGNEGFAAGANAGAELATGELLLFLNPDSVIADGFCAAIRRPLEQRRGWSAWMGLVTAEDGRVINTSGGIVHFSGIAWAGRAGRPADSAPAEPCEVAFASGACLAVPREVWLAHGGFSPAFFMYCEDVDLSLRLRLAGGRIGIEPGACVDHDYEFGKGAAKWRLLERNRWATIVRTYPTPLLVLLAPALLATELALAPVSIAGGWGAEKVAATRELLGALPRLLRERRAIQRGAHASPGEFAACLTPELSSPYLGRSARLRPLVWALRAYWAVVQALLRRASRSRGRGRTPAAR